MLAGWSLLLCSFCKIRVNESMAKTPNKVHTLLCDVKMWCKLNAKWNQNCNICIIVDTHLQLLLSTMLQHVISKSQIATLVQRV